MHSPLTALGIPLAVLLLALPYMWAPALANLFTRLLTREGWKELGLRPHFRKGWPFWLMGWVLPALMTIAGAAVFFLLFPRYFDLTITGKSSIPSRFWALFQLYCAHSRMRVAKCDRLYP